MRFSSFIILLGGLASSPLAARHPKPLAPLPRAQRLDTTPTFTLPLDLVGGLVVLRNPGGNGQTPASTTSVFQPRRQDATASFSVPFELVGGLILLRNLTVNGKRGSFLLDTGSKRALVVDNTAFADQLHSAPPSFGLGATGRVAQQEMPVSKLQFGAATYTGFIASALSLEQLRRYVGPKVPVLGLIGYGILRDYEVVIDYPHQRVTCYSLRTATPTLRPFVRQDSLAFTLVQGWPILTGYLGQVPVRLLLDTGSVTDELDATFCQKLAPASRPVLHGTDFTTGANGQRQLTQRGQIPSLLLGETNWERIPVQIFRFAQPASGQALPYQGILGHPFLLQQQVVSFHYGRRQLYSLVPQPAPAPRAGTR